MPLASAARTGELLLPVLLGSSASMVLPARLGIDFFHNVQLHQALQSPVAQMKAERDSAACLADGQAAGNTPQRPDGKLLAPSNVQDDILNPVV